MTSQQALHAASAMDTSRLLRAALDARQHRSALRRLLTNLATPTSEPHLDELRKLLRQEETQAAQSLQTLCPDAEMGSLAVISRKRRLESASDPEPQLKPRFRLLVHEEGMPTHILAVALCEGRPSGLAVLLSSGRLELWQWDPICWHLAASAKVPLPEAADGRLAFARSGQMLWLATSSEGGPVQTRLFERRGGSLQLLAVLQGPAQALQGGPAVLSDVGAALALEEVHVLRWGEGEGASFSLGVVASFSLGSGRLSLWPMPSLGDAPNQWRLAAVCGGELQLLDGLGQRLARWDLGFGVIAVPRQAAEDELLLLLLLRGGEWVLHLAAADGRLRRLGGVLAMDGDLEVEAVTEGLVAISAKRSALLDWQRRSLHELPPGWRVAALESLLVILVREGRELLFLEPD
ncbi:unnamed protein product [Effrenium voratum]|nr:unnamed protein product [Effrenium voratum]